MLDDRPAAALGDAELAAWLADLERVVPELREARQEAGLLIRARYTEDLNAVRVEVARRGFRAKTLPVEFWPDEETNT